MSTNSKEIPVLTGTAIPLGALKTKSSCGVGEFPDLVPFADFCKKAGLGLIQLLPVNDTGTESSPYSALSAFALHPIYISIEGLPEFDSVPDAKKALKDFHKKHDSQLRYNYRQLRSDKLKVLRLLFDSNVNSFVKDAESKNSEVSKWISENPWVTEYAVFMELKRQYKEASWKEWPEKYKRITKKQIEKRWLDEKLRENHLFYVWLQLRASQQFKDAAKKIADKGLLLKGDIPIMMNEDSADAWAHPEFFDDTMRAGSPPDGGTPEGQNWGFPVYRWDNLAKDGYSWWKNRLISASQYYKAYRIDHVLGFFRIWATPENESSAILGMTQPSDCISRQELHDIGFNDDRIRWLSQPHVPTRAIEDVNNNDYLGTHGYLHKLMDRIGNEELWLFKKEITGDKDIWNAPDIPDSVKARLVQFWRDRTLVTVSEDVFVPLWLYRDSGPWKSLSDDERWRLNELISRKAAHQEYLWEQQARTLLGELTSATDMIACAEDLGANPESLPSVLGDLSILRLCVIRWCRDWDIPGKPYKAFESYPKHSVATASVHDSSTLRLWWLTEPDANDFFQAFPPEESGSEIRPGVYTPETARYLLKKFASSGSCFCVHPLQDMLSLSQKYYSDDPQLERVNVPGSVNEFNWTYRLPVLVEDLISDKELISSIKEIVSLHQKN